MERPNAKTELVNTNQHSTERHESTQTNKDTHNSGKKSNYQNCSEVTNTMDDCKCYRQADVLDHCSQDST
jgi:hypothetical protein